MARWWWFSMVFTGSMLVISMFSWSIVFDLPLTWKKSAATNYQVYNLWVCYPELGTLSGYNIIHYSLKISVVIRPFCRIPAQWGHKFLNHVIYICTYSFWCYIYIIIFHCWLIVINIFIVISIKIQQWVLSSNMDNTNNILIIQY